MNLNELKTFLKCIMTFSITFILLSALEPIFFIKAFTNNPGGSFLLMFLLFICLVRSGIGGIIWLIARAFRVRFHGKNAESSKIEENKEKNLVKYIMFFSLIFIWLTPLQGYLCSEFFDVSKGLLEDILSPYILMLFLYISRSLIATIIWHVVFRLLVKCGFYGKVNEEHPKEWFVKFLAIALFLFIALYLFKIPLIFLFSVLQEFGLEKYFPNMLKTLTYMILWGGFIGGMIKCNLYRKKQTKKNSCLANKTRYLRNFLNIWLISIWIVALEPFWRLCFENFSNIFVTFIDLVFYSMVRSLLYTFIWSIFARMLVRWEIYENTSA